MNKAEVLILAASNKDHEFHMLAREVITIFVGATYSLSPQDIETVRELFPWFTTMEELYVRDSGK